MIKHNLKEIANFSKSNNNFSDFNIVNNFKLNFNKYKSINSKKQFGGNNMQPLNVGPDGQPLIVGPDGQVIKPNQVDSIQMQGDTVQSAPLGVDGQTPVGVDGRPLSIGPGVQSLNGQVGQIEPDKILDKPEFVTDSIKTYVIPVGTILYYSTDRKGFNVDSINLYGSGTLNGSSEVISLFTPNFRLASDNIQGCSADKQKGYIHAFQVIREIPDICIKLPFDTNNDISLENIHKNFCQGNEKYLGVGFFYPKNDIENFNNNIGNFDTENQEQSKDINDDQHYSEFYLCNPRPYLEYIYSQKCMSLRKISKQYKFTD